jgi:hypothetical protein
MGRFLGVLDNMGKDPKYTKGQTYMYLKANWPAYQQMMVEDISKELQKTTDPMQAEKLTALLKGIGADQDGVLLDAAMPETARALKMEEADRAAKLRPEGPKVVAPGGALVSPEGNILFQAREKGPDTPSELREFELRTYGKETPERRGTPQYRDDQITYLTEKKNATTAASKAEPKVLRQEFINQSKDFVTIRDAHNRIKSSATDPSPAGDLAMIFNYMKMLDPNSVVRESEFATAASAGSYGERIKAAADKILSGERLSDAMRKDFASRATLLFDEQNKSHQKLRSEYDRLAKESGVEPSQVLIDYLTDQKKIQAGEFEVGQKYQGQDGSVRIFRGKDATGKLLWEAVK